MRFKDVLGLDKIKKELVASFLQKTGRRVGGQARRGEGLEDPRHSAAPSFFYFLYSLQHKA